MDFTYAEWELTTNIDASGASIADFDDDGKLDIFLPNSKDAPSRLYRNLGNFQFEDVAVSMGVDDPSFASAEGLFLDYDHDGDLDLFVVGHLGKPTLVVGTTADLDGWTDLFASFHSPNSSRDQWRLFRNAVNPAPGDPADPSHSPRIFVDATPDSGLQGEWFGNPWMPTFWDVNRDGWPDLHVCQDFTLDLMFLNDQDGTFTEVATAVGLNGNPPENRNEMGTAYGDPDMDLDQDLHLTNKGNLDRFYRNDSHKQSLAFTDIAMPSGLNNSQFGWGTRTAGCRSTWSTPEAASTRPARGSTSSSATVSSCASCSRARASFPRRRRDCISASGRALRRARRRASGRAVPRRARWASARPSRAPRRRRERSSSRRPTAARRGSSCAGPTAPPRSG